MCTFGFAFFQRKRKQSVCRWTVLRGWRRTDYFFHVHDPGKQEEFLRSNLEHFLTQHIPSCIVTGSFLLSFGYVGMSREVCLGFQARSGLLVLLEGRFELCFLQEGKPTGAGEKDSPAPQNLACFNRFFQRN